MFILENNFDESNNLCFMILYFFHFHIGLLFFDSLSFVLNILILW